MSQHFSNQATEDLVRWLVENLTGTGLQELLRQTPPLEPDTPTEDLSQQLRRIFIQFLPPELQDWSEQINWVEVAAYLMALYEEDV